MGDIFPVGPLLRELVLALGAALVVGNVAVLIREGRRPAKDPGPRPNMKVVALNLVIGGLLALWGAGSLLAASRGG